MKIARKKTAKRYRSAVTGRTVYPGYVKDHRDTTIAETIHPRGLTKSEARRLETTLTAMLDVVRRFL